MFHNAKILKSILFSLTALFSVSAYANGWLPPSEDIVAERFDVYVEFDTTHNAGAELSKRDSVFQYIERQAVTLNSDQMGRIAVWRMLPSMVMVPDDIVDKVGTVRIIVENAPIATLPDTVRNDDGDLLLPYSIWAKVDVRDASGNKLYAEDYGLVNGFEPLSNVKKDGRFKQASAIVGISEVLERVRDDVFGKYGFDMCKKVDVCPVSESSKYYTFLKIVNGDVRRFVDFYAYNDLLCQIYKLNFPFEFLPYDTTGTELKSVEGNIVRNSEVIGDYIVEYENGRIRSFSGNVFSKDEDGKVNRQKLNKLNVQYDRKTGEYKGISTADGKFTRFIFPGYDNVTEWGKKNKLYNYCRTENVVGNFLKMKAETVETVEISLDLYGKIYIDGSTTSSLPFDMLKAVADTNNVKFPALTSENHSEFKCEIQFDKNLNTIDRQWSGSLLLEKDRGYNNYSYIKLDNVKTSLKVKKFDKRGNPIYFERTASGILTNNWGLGDKLKVFDTYKEGKSTVTAVPVKDKDDIVVDYSGSARVHISYDDKGNMSLYKIGGTLIVRNFKY